MVFASSRMFPCLRPLSLFHRPLTVPLHHLSNHSSDEPARHIAKELNETETVYPGTNLRLVYKIESPPTNAQTRALQALRRFHFTELDLQSLETDPEGGIDYVDAFLPISAGSETETGPPSNPVTAQATAPVSPFPAAARSSRRITFRY